MFLDKITLYNGYIYAAPAYWKAYLWQGFIDRDAGRVFTLDDMAAALGEGGFPMNWDRFKVGKAIGHWVSLLRRKGVVASGTGHNEFVTKYPSRSRGTTAA